MIANPLAAHLSSVFFSLVVSASSEGPSRSQLLDESSFWFHWLVGSTVAVAIGVVCELPECVVDLSKWLKHRKNQPVVENEKSWAVPFSVIGAVIVAVGVAVEGLAEYEGANVETVLRAHDEQVLANALSKAGSAKESAEQAANAAGTAEEIADAARSTAGSATKLASSASASAEVIGVKAEKLASDLTVAQTSMIAANTQLGEIEKKRKALEAYLQNVAICTAPRVIPEWYANGKTFVDALRPFKGFTAALVVANDPEAIHAGDELTYALNSAGILIKRITGKPNESISPGVDVESFGPANAPDVWPRPSSEASENASWAVVRFLHSYNWQAAWHDGFSSHTEDLSQHSIRIAIGRYPPPELITPPALEFLESAIADGTRQFDEGFKAENDRAFNERTKGFSPDKLEEAKAQREKWRHEMEVEHKNYIERKGGPQPCKPMKYP